LPESTTTRRTVVMVDAYSADEHIRAVREIFAQHHTLGALGELEDARDSMYAALLTEGAPA